MSVSLTSIQKWFLSFKSDFGLDFLWRIHSNPSKFTRPRKGVSNPGSDRWTEGQTGMKMGHDDFPFSRKLLRPKICRENWVGRPTTTVEANGLCGPTMSLSKSCTNIGHHRVGQIVFSFGCMNVPLRGDPYLLYSLTCPISALDVSEDIGCAQPADCHCRCRPSRSIYTANWTHWNKEAL